MKPIRLLLADDHGLVRAGICALLSTIQGVEVVAEATNGREALEMIKRHHPDQVLADISMPELNGLGLTARVTRDYPKVAVIILSMHAGDEYVRQALRMGARGYLLKDSAPAELELAIAAVSRGEVYLSPPVSSAVVARMLSDARSEISPLEKLTLRQREVLQLIAEGQSTRQIARKLHLSVKTVETHRTQLMDRLGIHDVASLVRLAVRTGLVSNH